MCAVLDAPCVPTRSLQQRMEALEHANAIRTQRAQLKRDLKARRVRVVDVLADPPREAMTMQVVDLLLAVPMLGRVKVNKMLRDGQISPSKSVGGMTQRQRDWLIERVDPFAVRL